MRGAQSDLSQWQDQEMSNAVWALAALQRPSPALCDCLAAEALRRGLPSFSAQAISNMVWGFAVLEYSHAPFLQARPTFFLPSSASPFWLNTAAPAQQRE